MIKDGWDVAIGHGNGPQVGFILRRSELAAHELHEVPLDVCGADSQGAIGYALVAEPRERLPAGSASTGTPSRWSRRCEVAADDPAFAHPTKPIGSFMDEATATRRRETGRLGRRRGRRPRLAARRRLARARCGSSRRTPIRVARRGGFVVVAVGGGGIPGRRRRRREPDRCRGGDRQGSRLRAARDRDRRRALRDHDRDREGRARLRDARAALDRPDDARRGEGATSPRAGTSPPGAWPRRSRP